MVILEALYFFLPVYFANMAPVLFKWIPFNKSVNEKLFGKNKTWRGLIVAVLLGTFIFYLQKLAYNLGYTKLAIIDYSDFSLLLGVLLSSGAILGDLIKSFYKRRAKIKPGESWPFWDQEDFVVGALLFSFLIYVPPAEIVLVILLVSPILHVATNYVGYLLGIRKKKF